MKTSAIAVAVASCFITACAKPSKYDVVIRHGTVYDGTGAAGKVGDVDLHSIGSRHGSSR